IRRYPDLRVHRTLRSVLRGESIDKKALLEELRIVGMESSRLERRAVTLERDVVDLYRAILLEERVGEEFDAQISGIANHGFYASLDSPFADALVPVERLPGHYEMNALGTEFVDPLSGHTYSLGEKLRIRLERVSVQDRQIAGVPAHIAELQPWETPEPRKPGDGPSKGGDRKDRRGRKGGGSRRGDGSQKGGDSRKHEGSRRERGARKNDSATTGGDERKSKKGDGSPGSTREKTKKTFGKKKRKGRGLGGDGHGSPKKPGKAQGKGDGPAPGKGGRRKAKKGGRTK
ncbi:MAG: S1 RNA-binding domain-containing protein, partial [Myxococcales bacterium]|nr:S1 RNA-binding domain-containing protein [Myxococcales bacterium]